MQMQLYNGDCGEVMRAFDDSSIDLTVTSPPYDTLRDYELEGIVARPACEMKARNGERIIVKIKCRDF